MTETKRNFWRKKRTDSDGENYEKAGGDATSTYRSRHGEKLL